LLLCRTYNGYDINGYGQLKDGRGNICPVTIIMPTLAMEADRDVEKFMKLLDKKIHEAKDMLLERYEWICSQPMESAKFMYENGTMYGYNEEEGIRGALKHGTLAIGQLGLAETLQLLIGCDQTDPKGFELGKRIEALFRKRADEFKQQYKLNFGVYLSPAENLSFTAMTKFKKRYGIIENVSDKKYFTNSVHVPVYDEISVFDKIDIESVLGNYSNSGTILYTELDGTVSNNLDALEEIVNYAMEKDVPYFAINVPNDQCLNCGYTAEINDKCPKCGSENIRRLRRVTGYLTNDYKTAFNAGKQQEVEMRVKHSNRKGVL
jgi:anaerobic ribonucleoside-triphosphate reductase